MPLNKKHIAGAAIVALAAVTAAWMVRAAGVFNPDAQPIGYVGQPAVSSTNVSAGTAKMYSIDYNARDWSGNVHAYPVSSAGQIGTVDDWGAGGASAKVKAQSVADSRFIVTIKNGAGIPFRWAELSQGAGGQREQLDPGTGGGNGTSSAVLDYIRGSAANEGTGAGQYRRRNYGLGDMIHSTPVYWNDGTNRTVFVGANDGMLHAINAVDGSERFAYVPAVLLPKLRSLTDQAYVHRYFVDGRLDVKKLGTQTILAGTLGGGGKAIFALDVSNAAATSEADAATKVLWEITNQSAGFADLGDTYGAPSLVTLPNGTNALVIGNGYNNTGNGHAMLYIINARTGALIKAYDTGVGTQDSPNGLSSPALFDSDGDGRKDTAYAGDIDGNLWKFSLAAPYTTVPVRLHTNTLGAAQAITMAPGLLKHPLGGVMVNFVTGRMLTSADATAAVAHYAYGIWDGAPADNDTLLVQSLSETNYTWNDAATRVRLSTSNVPNWTNGRGHHRGWRTTLPINGERVVGDGAFVTGEVFQFFSTNPVVNPTQVPPGENWWMQLNALTGGGAGTTLFDLNDDAVFTSDDQVMVTVAGQSTRADPVGRHMGGGVRSQLIALSAGGVDVFQSNYDRNTAPPAETVTTTTTTVDGERGVSGGHFDTDFFCYQNCGAATSLYRTINSSQGVYSVGKESGGDLDNLNYVHVHEYDDIYDRTGINMLHPSQDMQRLDLAKASTATTYVPNTPNHQATETFPGSGVTVVSTTIDRNKFARNVPSPDYVYSHSAQTAVAGFPTTTTNTTAVTKTSKTTYTTTLTVGEAINVGSRNSDRYYPYDWRTTVRRWTTTVTTVETFPNIRFKVLMANQAYSPAVKLTIGGAENEALTNATFNDSVFRYQSTAGLTVAALPTYKLQSLTNLVFSMPLDAFNIKNWGTGVSRTGLHPIRPQCAGVAVQAPTWGPLNEWRGGALSLQLVDPSVTDADIMMNVSGRPDLGYRLKTPVVKTKLIAEYLIYWHHPNDKCMTETTGDNPWTRSPPQDTSESDAVTGTPAAGENDPRGVFVTGTGEQVPYVPPAPAPVTVQNPDGSTTITTVTHTALASGGYTVTTTVRVIPPQLSNATGIVTGGAVSGSGDIDTGGINKNAANLGRINWRELQR